MPEIKPCPVCDELPANCTCPLEDRWIRLDGLWLHLTTDGFVDVRVFPSTTDKNIREASLTIREWAERVYREAAPAFGDLLAELDVRKRAGESWGDLAKAVNRRLASYTARMLRGDLTKGAALTFAWSDLRQLGIGDDRKGREGRVRLAQDLIDAVQRGEDPFNDDPPVSADRVKHAVKEWHKKHTP